MASVRNTTLTNVSLASVHNASNEFEEERTVVRQRKGITTSFNGNYLISNAFNETNA